MNTILRNNTIWYVCYGSNLLEERFLCYIKGGVIPGNTKSERGAKDKSLPLLSMPHILQNRIYFCLSIPKWDGSGVAFIDSTPSEETKTLGRKYLITSEQFEDVVRQENAVSENTPIVINEDELLQTGTTIVFPDKLYGRLLYLGEYDGIPLLTFTCISPTVDFPKGCLFGGYRDVIYRGIKETYGYDDKTIERYLKPYTK